MAKVYEFFADGFEEIEALTPVDMLRRAGDSVTTVSIMGRTTIHGSHAIDVEADTVFDQVDFSDGDLFILPGGKGTQLLMECLALRDLLKEKYEAGKKIAAICAAPTVLASLGMLDGKKAVVYPGLEEKMTGAILLDQPSVTDGTITTGHGAGAAMDFALELIRVLHGEEEMQNLKKAVVFQHD